MLAGDRIIMLGPQGNCYPVLQAQGLVAAPRCWGAVCRGCSAFPVPSRAPPGTDRRKGPPGLEFHGGAARAAKPFTPGRDVNLARDGANCPMRLGKERELGAPRRDRSAGPPRCQAAGRLVSFEPWRAREG